MAIVELSLLWYTSWPPADSTMSTTANDEGLLSSRFPKERLGVKAHPADLRAHRLHERERQHAIPFVCFLILEVDEVEHVDGCRQVGAVETLDGVEIEFVEHAHHAVLVCERCSRHLAFPPCCPY